MTTETRKRIRAYKKALPELRERVIAVALLLAMSASMLGSASFAWLTISRRPEVTAVSTTVAANGNLEVALASGNGLTPPGESQVGDSSAAKGQSVVNANLTWGNLINLSDASYGLEKMVMRPAQLNTTQLLTSPLYGADYSKDGRITQLNSDFGYTAWTVDDYAGERFAVTEDLGVRAISSMTYDSSSAEGKQQEKLKEVTNANLAAGVAYSSIANNKNYMQSLATMMGLYMTARMNSADDAPTLANPTCQVADIQNLRDMYAEFMTAYYEEANAIAMLLNYCLYLESSDGNYVPVTADQVLGLNGQTALKDADIKALLPNDNDKVKITNLTQFQKDYNTIKSDHAKLDTLSSSGETLQWVDAGINGIVNNLVDVGKCTIGADNTPISSIGASNAMGYLSGTQEAKITNGILYRFEERVGAYLEVKNLSISAKVKRMGITVPATVKANVQTTASRDYNLFNNDLSTVKEAYEGAAVAVDYVAEDTYGLALDLWVRTNAANSYLMLEGNMLTETSTEEAIGRDANGNEVNLFTVTRSYTDEEGNTSNYSIDVYPFTVTETDSAGTETTRDTWYSADNHMEVTLESGETPTKKMIEVVTVIGYEGENRIWNAEKYETMLSTDATTQGSGSCYVYYADTPEDQARSLKLLEAFNVAFIDARGKLLAKAVMDTASFYADNGRVTVPLVLSTSESINLGTDLEGNARYAITVLEQNEPTRITAIVYLDGTKLTNQDVLAAADIQGQLNIQFGSSMVMEPIENEELMSQTLTVSASVDQTSFDWDAATGPLITNVEVNVDGAEPSTVTAFFLRSISQTQGSREDPMTFTKNADGKWVSSYQFKAPGKYVLRSVRLDGVDYLLDTVPEVTVTGFTVTSLQCTEADGSNHINIMSAAGSSTVNMSLSFASDNPEKMPKKVQGRYLREDGSAVNVDFSLDKGGVWKGSATFLTSGEYTLEYLVLDGEYVHLDPSMWQTASVTLGMRVAVYTTSPHTFKYIPDDMTENMNNLAMQVMIMDNAGEEMRGMSGVKLTYGMKGSALKKMDADLTWDGSYYSGVMPNGGPGIWQFSNVTVGGNTLTNATTSPTFTIQSPEPPEYYAHGTTAYQYKPNNDAVMNVQITNSSAASVQACIVKNGTAQEIWVTGTIGSELTTTGGKTANNWSFAVPKDANGYQDGNWQLTALKLWDVFAADGTAYTEESPLEIDVSNTNNKTKVVNRITMTFPQGQSKDFGKDASGNVTATFMDSHTISGLNVNITDFEGAPVQGVTEVQLTFEYVNQSCSDYGGYSRSDLTNGTAGATITVPLNKVNGANFAQSTDAPILYAGKYNTIFSFKVSNMQVTYSGDSLPGNAPVFTVWSKVPTVTISAITPNGPHSTIGSNDQTQAVTSKIEGNKATVYCNTTRELNGKITEHPSVTLMLNNMGKADSAALVFSGDTNYIYTGQSMNGQTDAFTWTSANNTSKRFVGQYRESNSCRGMTRNAAGTLTSANTFTMVCDDITYTIQMSSQIVIENPN